MKRIPIFKAPNFLDQQVKVAGWVNNFRTHGKIVFVDLRDRSGLLQITFSKQSSPDVFDLAKKLKPEWVIEVIGKVQKRPKGTENSDLVTGEIELLGERLKILSVAKTLPFSIQSDGYEISEEKRLKYRYLDLRRERLRRNLILRQEAVFEIRNFLKNNGFIEIETPILTKATPEGARDFLVPSRLQPGKFYALPQSPQQYKQLLMVTGIEKYFQIARCFRDEDPRADRQAEFTQIDLEMSFVEMEDVLRVIEKMIQEVVKKIFPQKRIKEFPFPRLNYQEIMEKYNTDKPDLRERQDDKNELSFAFIVNFPMFEWSEKEKRWKTVHHPFTRPQTDDVSLIKEKPQEILAYQYDLVLNGYEIGGGSLRSYKREILEAVFEVLGHKKEEVQKKFGHLLEAFEYGVPPHGGIAIGLDRFLAILLNEPNIREVIPFPKTGDSQDLMMGAPSEVEEEQLKELHIKIEREENEKSDISKNKT
ncbi:MAG: aspartate--tRNA ligase [Candidatus Pacebacteria bacterium]|nr:aspartate--tRNA ligase [Candidatus Paceibacterota bacterium]